MRTAGGLGFLLFLGTLVVFWPLATAQFVNFDDPGYVYENPLVIEGVTARGAMWAFSTFHKANWHPFTWLSHMLDVEFFGLDPGRHHLVSVFLHALNAWLLVLFLTRTTGARAPSLLVGALFAFHPLHVESVAWISERKDVLATLFWMLALLAYAKWAKVGGGLRYGLVLLLLIGGLLAKPMVVTLPCVLLLLDIWPLARVRWAGEGFAGADRRKSIAELVLEKWPLFLVAAASSAVTVLAQRTGGAVVALPTLPISARLTNAVSAYVWYLEKTFWPEGLAVLYPHPLLGDLADQASQPWLLPVFVLAGLTLAVVAQVKRRPYLLVGWLWFLGTLVPVIGLVQVGSQATADRYTYIPLIGVFVAVAWLAADVAATSVARRVTVGLVMALWLIGCVTVTRSQLAHWQSARTLAERSVAVTSGNFVMHYNLALALGAEGDLEGARENYARASEIRPGQAVIHANLAEVLVRLGRYEEAVQRYALALQMGGANQQAANNLAWLLATHRDPALRDGRRALQLARRANRASKKPDPRLLDTLAAAQAENGDFAGALRTASRAARVAQARGLKELAVEITQRRQGYRQGRPHREAGAPSAF